MKRLFLLSSFVFCTSQLIGTSFDNSYYFILESAIKSGSYALVLQMLPHANLSNDEKKNLLKLADETEAARKADAKADKNVASYGRLKGLGTAGAVIVGIGGGLISLLMIKGGLVKAGAGAALTGAAVYGCVRARNYFGQCKEDALRKIYGAYGSAVQIKNYLTMKLQLDNDKK